MKGEYKRKHTQAIGVLLVLALILVSSSGELWSGKPQTLCPGYLSASQGVGLLPYREVFFICSSVCVQGYLGHPELVLFSCLWVSWVACHPASTGPSTRAARTASPWIWVAHMGSIMTSVNPQIHPVSPSKILASLGGPKKLHHPRGLVQQPKAVAFHNCPLNC